MTIDIEFLNGMTYFVPLVFAFLIMLFFKKTKGVFPQKETGGYIIIHTYELSCAIALLVIFLVSHEALYKFHSIMHMVYVMAVKIIWDSFNDLKEIYIKYSHGNP